MFCFAGSPQSSCPAQPEPPAPLVMLALRRRRDTALHYAAGSGSRGCVEVLLAFGAPAGQLNALGASPAEVAERAGHKQLASFLRGVAGGTITALPERQAAIDRYLGGASSASSGGGAGSHMLSDAERRRALKLAERGWEGWGSQGEGPRCCCTGQLQPSPLQWVGSWHSGSPPPLQLCVCRHAGQEHHARVPHFGRHHAGALAQLAAAGCAALLLCARERCLASSLPAQRAPAGMPCQASCAPLARFSWRLVVAGAGRSVPDLAGATHAQPGHLLLLLHPLLVGPSRASCPAALRLSLLRRPLQRRASCRALPSCAAPVGWGSWELGARTQMGRPPCASLTLVNCRLAEFAAYVLGFIFVASLVS